jgi:hypothetical protein
MIYVKYVSLLIAVILIGCTIRSEIKRKRGKKVTFQDIQIYALQVGVYGFMIWCLLTMPLD